MTLDAKKVEKIYASKVARKYDFSMPPLFARWKKKAFDESDLKPGHRVLVFCCGTGLDFPHIIEKIGAKGLIVGVDFSFEMLSQAKARIKDQGWDNVELVQADITEFKDRAARKYDAGACTLGMSIIPEYKTAFHNLCSHVRENGQIIIGDMQLATGWRARLNPITVRMARKFGGTHEGHQNSLDLRAMIETELKEVKTREFFFNAYYYAIGRMKKEVQG